MSSDFINKSTKKFLDIRGVDYTVVEGKITLSEHELWRIVEESCGAAMDRNGLDDVVAEARDETNRLIEEGVNVARLVKILF